MSGDLLEPDRQFGLSKQWLARTTGIIYSSGAVVAFVYIALPHGDEAGDAVVLAMATLALGLGIAMAAGAGDHASQGVFHVVVAVIQIIIFVGCVATENPTTPLFLFYLWTTTYAWLMFDRRPAIAQTAWTACCLSGSLFIMRAPLVTGVRVAMMVMGTAVAMGLLVGVVADRMRRSQAQLRHAASHDPLTGLPNRRFFAAAVDRMVHGSALAGQTVHVLLIDVDHFKLINDNYGHLTGDDLLIALADRLRAAAGPGPVVARMGGDEFAVVVQHAAQSTDIYALLERLAGVWNRPLSFAHGNLSLSASIGVATAAPTSTEAGQLLREADIALYHAKSHRRGSFARFDSALAVQVQRRATLDQALHQALPRAELTVLYQPIVDLSTERAHRAEALLRWDSGAIGEIHPDEFIPVAEESGLIVPIGEWVLNQVADQLSQWRSTGETAADLSVTVNVSVRQLTAGFAGRVLSILAAHGLPVTAIALEITESVLLGCSEQFGPILAELRDSRIRLILDDFGTGYSSLSYLQKLRLDKLKIDRSFVTGLPASRSSVGLVTAMIAMAASLDMEVVAEGVETDEQAALLRTLGVRWAQGFLFGHPMPATQLLRWMACSARHEPGSAPSRTP